MNYLILLLKGFIIGVAKIMPGVSGAMLSISFGVYEKILSIIAHPFKIKFSDLKFLFFLLLGSFIGIVLLCDFLKWCLNNYFYYTMCFFIGLIVGGIPDIIKEVRGKITIIDTFLFIVSFILIFLLVGLDSGNNSSSNHFFFMGAIESLTTIIPGISGTAVFMALGWYDCLLDTIKCLLTFSCSLNISLLFISGFVISTIIISWILSFIFKKYKRYSYICVLGFMLASLGEMISDLSSINLLGVILFFTGYYITYFSNNLFSNF